MDDLSEHVLALARAWRRLYPLRGIHGLEPAEMQVLLALSTQKEATVSELGGVLELSRPSAFNVLKSRHELGWYGAAEQRA